MSREGNAMAAWRERITTNPEQCGGRPCIREELPDLEPADIEAALLYARSRLDQPFVAKLETAISRLARGEALVEISDR
jgi:uncharacterized protein (DUF433 family)